MSVPIIAIVNQTSVLSDDQVQKAMAAMQKQVDLDFCLYWGQKCRLVFQAKNKPLPAGWWEIAILDDPTVKDALGFHELSSVGTPIGYVFAKLDLDSGMSWTVTFSHELLEMLADPDVNLIAEAPDGRLFAYEVGDPVEADALAWTIDGVLVSDFVTPKWFQPSALADRYDFKKHLSAGLTLAPGGYIGVLDPTQGWTQLTAEKAPSLPAMQVLAGVAEKLIPEGSRRHRRTIPKALWRRSER